MQDQTVTMIHNLAPSILCREHGEAIMDSPVDRGKGAAPTVVFVAGQPGSGAAGVAGALQKTMRRGTAVIDLDEQLATAPDGEALVTSLVEKSPRRRRIDFVLHTTLIRGGDVTEPAEAFRAAGYRIEVAIVAVPEALSRMALLKDHFAAQGMDAGLDRRHDLGVRNVRALAQRIEQTPLVDVAAVYDRYGKQLAVDPSDPAAARTGDCIERALLAEHERRWSAAETQRFVSDFDYYRKFPQLTDALVDLARSVDRQLMDPTVAWLSYANMAQMPRRSPAEPVSKAHPRGVKAAMAAGGS